MTTTPGTETGAPKTYAQPEAAPDVTSESSGTRETVTMKHEGDGRITTASREAFDVTWSKLGWQELTGDELAAYLEGQTADAETAEPGTAVAAPTPPTTGDPTPATARTTPSRDAAAGRTTTDGTSTS